jgi:uncharacterized protein YbaP (TraB family)
MSLTDLKYAKEKIKTLEAEIKQLKEITKKAESLVQFWNEPEGNQIKKMHTITLTASEYTLLIQSHGYDKVTAAIASVVTTERNEDWIFLNQGISDFSMVDSICAMAQ